MKKITAILLSLVLVLSMSLSNVVFANSEITVKLNGKTLSFDVLPQIINGRTMVPVRVIFEELGATVNWGDNIVTSVKDDITVSLTIDAPTIIVNGVAKGLDAAPCIIDGRTLVPARAVSEAFDMNVEWDSVTKTVLITESVKTEEPASTTEQFTDVDVDPYNKLKNIILSQGEEFKELCLIYCPPENNLKLIIAYSFAEDCILLISYRESEELYTAAIIRIYADTEPTITFESEFTDGNYYKMFIKREQSSFVVERNDFPDLYEELPYEFINTYVKIINALMLLNVEMSLYDFGTFLLETSSNDIS